MREELVREIMSCLPKGRTFFYYFKDRYALLLLSYLIGNRVAIPKLRQTRFSKLLQKPLVKELISTQGGGDLSREHLNTKWPDETECYLLTVGKWGFRKNWHNYFGYDQTSRPGTNLVLQLNFSSKHNSAYTNYIKVSNEDDPFKAWGHPTAEKRYHTLAWARMDIDFHTDEALIEEIQNDWIRYAFDWRDYLEKSICKSYGSEYSDAHLVLRALNTYIEAALSNHARMWDEAMLSAAIWFLREEIGIKTIYYHDYSSGNRLKSLRRQTPPRSLYTNLPKKFCFEKTDSIPKMLRASRNNIVRRKLKRGNLNFWCLEF